MDFNKLIGQFMGGQSEASSDKNSGGSVDGKSMAMGAALGGLAGFAANSSRGKRVMRQTMRAGQTAAGIGGIALVGGLAYKAFSDYRRRQGDVVATTETAAVEDADGLLILRAMIAAAASDGEIDRQEYDQILGQAEQGGLTSEEKQFLLTEMDNPVNARALALQVHGEQQAVQVFAAANMAIDIDTDEERAFLDDLGGYLKLDLELMDDISTRVMYQKRARTLG